MSDRPYQLLEISIEHETNEQIEQFRDAIAKVCAEFAWDGADWNFTHAESHRVNTEEVLDDR